MHKLWQFFVKNNRFSYLLMLALAGFGIFSLVIIPKESTPEVQIPVGVVTVVLPGAPASDVETLVTNEIERGLSGRLENVKSITSTSREGVSSVVVEFEASADIDKSIADLKDEVDTIKPDLPDDAEDPFVSELNFVDQPVMLVAISGEFTDSEITKLSDEIELQLESLSGVSRVEFGGVKSREVSVIVDQASLNQFNLSLSEVIRGLQTANLTFPVGQIESDNVSYNIAFLGDIENPNEIASIPITSRGGQPIYVRDVARVVDGHSDSPIISRLSVGGTPSEQAMTINVFKQRGGDITRITQSVADRLTELNQQGQLLENANVLVVYDAGNDIHTELRRLSTSGLTTVTLVILVLILAIGWREGLVAGSAIPLSFLIGFIGLYATDNTINFVSLFALVLAVGILVDSAIVMVEGINKRMKKDLTVDKREAALDTIKEFSIPLMTGTLTTVSMFSGLFLVSGVTGQFIHAIPFTINFILFASLLVALGFVPLIASTTLRRRSATQFEQQQVKKARQLENWYRRKLEIMLDHARYERHFIAAINGLLLFALFLMLNVFASFIAGVLMYALTLFVNYLRDKYKMWEWLRITSVLIAFVVSGAVAAVLAFTVLPKASLVEVIFFEQSDIDFIYAEVELPEGSVKEDTDIAARRVEEVLYTHPEVASFVTTIGSGSQFAGDGFSSGGANEKRANMFINLKKDRNETSTEVVEDLRTAVRDMRDIKITVDQPSDGPPTGNPLGYRFLGDDLNELTRIAEQSAQILKEIHGTANITTSATNNNTEFVFTLDKAKAAALGLDPFTVSQVLRAAVYGTDATTLTTLDEEIDVVVKMNLTGQSGIDTTDTNQTTVEALENIELKTPSGSSVLLSSIVDVSLRESSSVINHEDNKRIISVSGAITADGNVREINRQFEEQIRQAGILPSDVELDIGGETEESNQAFIEMLLALIVGVVLMLAVLVLQFNSYLHTQYVLSILPYSLIGIMFGLAITQLPLSFPSVMGFIALSGIVVNNSILLIDQMNSLRLQNPRMEIRDVVLEAASSRLRPILLTTITTVVGMIPLTYASDLWSPLAYAIMYGLTFSVIITLILVPIMYHRKPGKVMN